MAVMTTERPESEEDGTSSQDDLRRHAEVIRALHDQLDPPEGYRVEIIEGKITVAATPFGKHASIVRRIRMAIEPTLPSEEYGFYENLTCEEPEIDRYVPDLGVWPVEYVDSDDEWVFAAEMCVFAAEVTSPQQAKRDYAKAIGYARAGVPVYLIVDRTRRVCVVLTEPEGGTYKNRHEEPFGKPVALPLDPPVTIDTSRY
jgi:Uma2 family endonuclease